VNHSKVGPFRVVRKTLQNEIFNRVQAYLSDVDRDVFLTICVVVITF